MDALAAAQFANYLGRFYSTLAAQIDDYLHQNLSAISRDQMTILSQDQTRLLSYSNTFLALSDSIAFQGADACFQQVQDATGQITDALKHIDKVDKIITISANVIGLAGGIVSGNIPMIVGALSAIKGVILG